jgi:hypothetical protein
MTTALKFAGDHGDPDLGMALDEAAKQKKPVAICVFGHMHHRCLNGGIKRKRVTTTADGVLHINATVVPRHKARMAGIARGPSTHCKVSALQWAGFPGTLRTRAFTPQCTSPVCEQMHRHLSVRKDNLVTLCRSGQGV